MMKFIKVFAILFFTLSVSYAQEPAKQMPDFSFVTTTGETFKKSDLNKAHNTLIVFFDATCSHCQKAGTFFNSHLKDLKPYNVLFITMDEDKAIQLFMKDYAPLIPTDKNVKILRDTAYYFVPNFLPKRFPAIYVYNKKQELELYTSDEKELDAVLNKLKALK
ncbi:peroxiredoxin family protein [Pedobacter arcticus]|uniref:peroxiredoxin family protein n=1 Tax=Pedobacter arcticus TaxID=752140 RepID=UPI0002EF96D8|nr:redoxin domain-containing protein [Pedobacter arcticus]